MCMHASYIQDRRNLLNDVKITLNLEKRLIEKEVTKVFKCSV